MPLSPWLTENTELSISPMSDPLLDLKSQESFKDSRKLKHMKAVINFSNLKKVAATRSFINSTTICINQRKRFHSIRGLAGVC